MHEKIKEFLDAQKEIEAKKLEKEKKKVLKQLGLFEKEYSPTPGYSKEYPIRDQDSNETDKYYKRVYYDITNEEFEEIKKYYNPEPEFEITTSPISKILTVIAWINYIVLFIIGFLLIQNFVFSLIVWIVGFVSGSFILGFAEIIKLIDKINDKIN